MKNLTTSHIFNSFFKILRIAGSLKTYFKFLAILIFFLGLYTLSPAQSPFTITVKKMAATPNPNGLQLGFWEVYKHQAVTLQYMGKRPTSRADFDNWADIETSKGVYDFTGVFDVYKQLHDYGESILGAVNVSFTPNITTDKNTVPVFYTPDITDTVTRQAAKNFIYAYVQEALKETGALTLTIDYEICSNYKLTFPGSEATAAMWGAWYVEAAAVARKAAADMGMANNLKLEPIVNGNPFADGNPIFKGPAYNQWLVNVVNASDYLALDTYQSDSIYSNTSAQTTFNIIQFWIDNYAGNKDVVVTENGFNTSTQIDSNFTRVQRKYKYTGTEADQAVFYQNLFPQFMIDNQLNGIFHNKVRSYNMWSIMDNMTQPVGAEERYFGILGVNADSSLYAKAALPVVQNAYTAIDTNYFLRPYNTFAGIDITTAIMAGTANIPVTYSNGDDFEFVRYVVTALPAVSMYALNVNTSDTGNVIIHVNNQWLYYGNKIQLNADITAYMIPGADNVIDLYFTNEKFPFTQHIQSVSISKISTNNLWIGKTSTAWEEPLNWKNNIVPDAGTNVYINAGTPFSPEITSQAFCRVIYVNPAATVKVNTGYNLTVTGPAAIAP